MYSFCSNYINKKHSNLTYQRNRFKMIISTFHDIYALNKKLAGGIPKTSKVSLQLEYKNL